MPTSDSHSPGILTIPLHCLRRIFTNLMPFASAFPQLPRWAQRIVICLLYLDKRLVTAESIPSLLEYHKLLLQLSKDLGNVINFTKSDHKSTSKAQYLRMMTNTIQERVYPTDHQITRFKDVADKFRHLMSLSAKTWQQILDHTVDLKHFVPNDRVKMQSFQWQVKSLWTALLDDPAETVTSLDGC